MSEYLDEYLKDFVGDSDLDFAFRTMCTSFVLAELKKDCRFEDELYLLENTVQILDRDAKFWTDRSLISGLYMRLSELREQLKKPKVFKAARRALLYAREAWKKGKEDRGLSILTYQYGKAVQNYQERAMEADSHLYEAMIHSLQYFKDEADEYAWDTDDASQILLVQKIRAFFLQMVVEDNLIGEMLEETSSALQMLQKKAGPADFDLAEEYGDEPWKDVPKMFFLTQRLSALVYRNGGNHKKEIETLEALWKIFERCEQEVPLNSCEKEGVDILTDLIEAAQTIQDEELSMTYLEKLVVYLKDKSLDEILLSYLVEESVCAPDELI